MRITEDKWKAIVRYHEAEKKISMIGSVNSAGQPNVTPIGSLILRDDCTGYYFDLFTKGLSDNLDHNDQVCVLLAETGTWFWFKSLWADECKKPSGMKLIGTAGSKRRASNEEIELVRNQTKFLKLLKGYHTIFGDLSYVRDITFTDYFMINTGKMTCNL
ncbi:MAG: pyridoxamine 5'-phosphate oxidase family protein [Methylocystaceae bacterium]